MELRLFGGKSRRSWLERLTKERTSGLQLDKGHGRIFSDEVGIQGT